MKPIKNLTMRDAFELPVKVDEIIDTINEIIRTMPQLDPAPQVLCEHGDKNGRCSIIGQTCSHARPHDVEDKFCKRRCDGADIDAVCVPVAEPDRLAEIKARWEEWYVHEDTRHLIMLADIDYLIAEVERLRASARGVDQ